MKFKELKKVLSCSDTFEIGYNYGKLKRAICCNGENIDKISNSYRLNNKEVIIITPTDEKSLFISLK